MSCLPSCLFACLWNWVITSKSAGTNRILHDEMTNTSFFENTRLPTTNARSEVSMSYIWNEESQHVAAEFQEI